MHMTKQILKCASGNQQAKHDSKANVCNDNSMLSDSCTCIWAEPERKDKTTQLCSMVNMSVYRWLECKIARRYSGQRYTKRSTRCWDCRAENEDTFRKECHMVNNMRSTPFVIAERCLI